ncbi:MAG TPA: amino acid ABC transporter permease [Acidimicrobiales bacterium]
MKRRILSAALALAGAIGAYAVLAAALISFDRSLGLVDTELLITRLVLVAIAAAGFSVVAAGANSLRHALRARRLADTDLHEARVAAEDAKDAIWWVVGLGLTSLVVAFLAIFLSANDGAVRDTFFQWHYFGLGFESLLRAFWLNIKLFLVAEVFVLIWGLVVAIARLLPGKAGAPVRFLAVAYTDLFRGMPAVMVIYLTVFGLGLAKLPIIDQLSRDQQRFWLPVLALTLVYGAYVAEVYRSGLESIHWSQTAAARSLGLNHVQTLRFVIVPQAVRRIVPPLLNDFIGLQKDTALLAFVGVVEVFNQSTLLKSKYFNLTPVIAAGLLFVVITIPMARFTDYLVRRDQARMRAGGT